MKNLTGEDWQRLIKLGRKLDAWIKDLKAKGYVFVKPSVEKIWP